jgi:hypothetical protein
MRFSSPLRAGLILSVLTVAFAQDAAAQEKKVGLVVGYPADLGVLWQASERVALRADVGFTFNTTDISTQSGLSFGSSVPTTITTTSSSANTSIGLSALFTIRNEDNLRLYIAPRGALQLVHYSVEADVEPPSAQSSTRPGEASDVTHGYEAEFMFGGQYRLRDRVAVFGETGLSYRQSSFPRLTTTFSVGGASVAQSGPDSHSTSLGLRGSAGLVLFF